MGIGILGIHGVNGQNVQKNAKRAARLGIGIAFAQILHHSMMENHALVQVLEPRTKLVTLSRAQVCKKITLSIILLPVYIIVYALHINRLCELQSFKSLFFLIT